MQKVKIFGTDAAVRKYNVIVALVMGAAVVFPHVMGYYPPDGDIVVIMNQSLPNVSVVLIAIVMALLIIGVMGKRFEIGGNSLSGWIAMAAFGVVIYIFGNAANWWNRPEWMYFLDNPDMMALIIVILVFAIIIWFVTKGEKSDNEKELAQKMKMSNQFNELLKNP
jgi:flagellar biogenesis protein FliO